MPQHASDSSRVPHPARRWLKLAAVAVAAALAAGRRASVREEKRELPSAVVVDDETDGDGGGGHGGDRWAAGLYKEPLALALCSRWALHELLRSLLKRRHQRVLLGVAHVPAQRLERPHRQSLFDHTPTDTMD